MFGHLTRTVVKVVLASLIVGTILAHFGLTADDLMRATGFSTEHLEHMARRGVTWALPNLLLGLAGDRSGLVSGLSVPSAGREPGLTAILSLRRTQRAAVPRAPVSFASSEAASTATPTTATKMVHTALISGFTPRRTSE